MIPFANRAAAGIELAAHLAHYRDRDDVLVLGLPRGGVPVASEVAKALGAELDVMIVRKLGAPLQPELALGAVASGGIIVVNEEVSSLFANERSLRKHADAELNEVTRRERLYRGDRPPLATQQRSVILVDDGSATGASMLAAVRAVRALGAKRIVVALPVASIEACSKLEQEADEVICPAQPEWFNSVGQWYRDFGQTQDAEVIELLRAAELSHAAR